MQTKREDRFVVVAGLPGLESLPTSKLIIASASRNAASTKGGELHLVHVLEKFEPAPIEASAHSWGGTAILEAGRRYLESMGAEATKSFAGRVVGHLAVGETWREIVQFAERLTADLIVVGTHDRTGVRRLVLGSVSERVSRSAKCPVLVVRPKDYAVSDVPSIEPACPDCLKKQTETGGAVLWCDRHASHHPVAHVHYEFPQSFAVGSQLFHP